jgi:hypothetical protein
MVVMQEEGVGGTVRDEEEDKNDTDSPGGQFRSKGNQIVYKI